MRKISSVLELSQYKVGDSAWWITLVCQNQQPDISTNDIWMLSCHPKILYEHGPYKKCRPFRAKLPRLHHSDFNGIMAILTSEFIVEEFEICEIVRSTDTGEMIYANSDDIWMPESLLFDTAIAAGMERDRIIKMLRKWTDK